MKLIINGKPIELATTPTVAAVAKALGYEGEFFAVALNRICVARSAYAETPVNEGDEIEILTPMQGG